MNPIKYFKLLIPLTFLWSVESQAIKCRENLAPEGVNRPSFFVLEPPGNTTAHPLRVELSSTDVAVDLSRASIVLERLRVTSHVETLVYPFAGFDAGTPYELFKSVRSVVAIDDSPFVRNLEAPITTSGPVSKIGGKVFLTGQSARATSVANVIVKQLSSRIPNFRVLEATAFVDPNIFSTHVDGKTVHGIIFFDTGPGTEVRTYTHIHMTLGDHRTKEELWWYSQLVSHGFQAVVSKGAMGGLADNAPKLGKDMMVVLARNSGIYFDAEIGYNGSEALAINAGGKLYFFPWLTGYADGGIVLFGDAAKLVSGNRLLQPLEP